MDARGRDYEAICRVRRKGIAQLLRFDWDIDCQGKHFEVRQRGGCTEPQRPWPESVVDDHTTTGEVPRRLVQ